jgi:flagellar basal-body rod modification protein FlgD
MAVESVSQSKLDYMNLLVTQMKNQNPMKPMDNQEMTSQMTQFSQLEQLENLNSNFSDALQSANLNYASSLLGKEVTFRSSDEDGNTKSVTATVEKIQKGSDSEIQLVTSEGITNLNDVSSVQK